MRNASERCECIIKISVFFFLPGLLIDIQNKIVHPLILNRRLVAYTVLIRPQTFLTHLEDEGGDGGVVFGTDEGKSLGKVALSGTHEKQTRAGKEKAVQTAKCGEGNTGRHGVHHHSKGTTGERLKEAQMRHPGFIQVDYFLSCGVWYMDKG